MVAAKPKKVAKPKQKSFVEPDPPALDELEIPFQVRLIKLARHYDWRAYYIPRWMQSLTELSFRMNRRGDRDWYDKGFPDVIFATNSPGPRVVIVETKSAKGSTSREQKWWIGVLDGIGLDVRIWKPKDWEEARRVFRQEDSDVAGVV